ncbi:MAG: isoaspartyl peptidase/L-asparaginase [Eubacteriales bacterium]|nr:isoaspartyl peptidase/L-asparaginase [Eubacteriales bacterium]
MSAKYAMISTWKMSLAGMRKAKRLMESGGSARDALAAAITDVEDDPAFHSVGYSGLPNARGEVELDAGFMNGRDLSFGAVSGVKNIKNPILVARELSGLARSCFLTAAGAESYAAAHGFAMRNMLTEDALAAYRRETAKQTAVREADPAADAHDTVCVVAQDTDAELYAGVSTSGLFMKHPGRVGDSPVIGSGFYCDSTAGGAAATGFGEDVMRGCLSVRIVGRIAAGRSPQEACEEVLEAHLARLADAGYTPGNISVIALGRDGRFGAATNRTEFPFVVFDEAREATLMVCRSDGGRIRVEEADAAWLESYKGD